MESIFNQKFIDSHKYYKDFPIDLHLHFKDNHYETYENCEVGFDPDDECLVLFEPGEITEFSRIPIEKF